MSGTWGAPILPSGLDQFTGRQEPNPAPVDDLSEFVMARIRFAEVEPRSEVPQRYKEPLGPMVHRYAAGVRRDMVAFRRIVAEYAAASTALDAAEGEDEHNEQGARMLGLRLAVAAIAMRFADHPDFRDEWQLTTTGDE